MDWARILAYVTGTVATLDDAKAGVPSQVSGMASNPMTDKQRRALELLAANDDGCTDTLLLARGFALDLIVGLVRTRLATAKVERTFGGGRAIEVTRVRITESGRRVLVKRRQ